MIKTLFQFAFFWIFGFSIASPHKVLLSDEIVIESLRKRTSKDSVVWLGPFLWKQNEIKKLYTGQKLPEIAMFGSTNTETKILRNNNYDILLKHLIGNKKNNEIKIRGPSKKELGWYQLLVPFASDSDLVMVEIENRKIAIGFQLKDTTKYFIDDFSDLSIPPLYVAHDDLIKKLKTIKINVQFYKGGKIDSIIDFPKNLILSFPQCAGHLLCGNSNHQKGFRIDKVKPTISINPSLLSPKPNDLGKDYQTNLLDNEIEIMPKSGKFIRYGQFVYQNDITDSTSYGQVYTMHDRKKKWDIIFTWFESKANIFGYLSRMRTLIDIKIPEKGYYCLAYEQGKIFHVLKETSCPNELEFRIFLK